MAKRKRPSLKTSLRSAIRKVWMWSEERAEAKRAARVGFGKYKCSECLSIVGPKAIEIDHIISATPSNGINKPSDFGHLIQRLLFKSDEDMTPITVAQLRALCKPCHAIKTKSERASKKRG